MNVNAVGSYLVSAVRSIIKGAPMPEKPEAVAWDGLVHFALQHKVANILAYGAANREDIPGAVHARLQKELQLTVVQETKQEQAAKELYKRFEQEGLAYLPLKGIVMKHYYPSPDMRTMSDIDILIEKGDAHKARAIMEELDYRLRFSNMEEDAYLRPPFVSIELHKSLAGASHKQMYEYYKNPWRFAKKREGLHCYMTDEDYYIYHIAHLAKHYKERGTGIRSLLDIQIYLHKKEASMDWEYIHAELAKLGLGAFAGNLRGLASMWFDGGERNDVLTQMEQFIFESGVYGKLDNFKAIQNSESAFRRYLRLAFPPIKVMSGLYPVLQKYPGFMPVFWIYRIFTRIFIQKKHVEIGDRGASQEQAKKLAQHFDNIGLK